NNPHGYKWRDSPRRSLYRTRHNVLLSKPCCPAVVSIPPGESLQFVSQRGPVPALEPELREETRLRAADPVFRRQQVVPHLRLIDDGSISARNFHQFIRWYLRPNDCERAARRRHHTVMRDGRVGSIQRSGQFVAVDDGHVVFFTPLPESRLCAFRFECVPLFQAALCCEKFLESGICAA